ncbi:bacillithiol biosynthesis cysteine-adding enzyme BshC [Halobacillus litoralis]|uniref:bacillithiol biosynthesis cysteine-adding enzyme BshC n=1 Tax=Halobacillus litoralis TaxID=45668 RepID=UPI001CD20612|nr:bacillithiol biosynthesis cysteine-adding enzyme BshC [Halobacillus litoralis]MCA0969377.1 bacillithiol biosynthesis cysteine-adding enzyme BshC [Halobacillus litoralis]
MEAIDIQPKQRFFTDYQQRFDQVSDQFQYNPHESTIYRERYATIQKQSYQRDALADVLVKMNEKWEAPQVVFDRIKELRDPNSAVVIAGQQAGLMTGPLYTIHKAISVLQLAKQQEEQIGESVIPVFWIAGEDHDFDEVNHIFLKDQDRMKKHTIQHQFNQKQSVSDMEVDQEQAEKWLTKVFSEQPETAFTHDLLKQCLKELKSSGSYTDFFARLMYQLLPESGLVLFDAHDPEVRELEKPYFNAMIEHNESIAQGVYAMLQQNRQRGYETLLDSELEDAHLFYDYEGERTLLVRDEEGRYKGKNDEVVLTKEELLRVVSDQPRCMSNNVVTRPLMQDFLFPVLAFIGGPGEINYWSALKPAFESVGLEMPPVIPRLSFTMMDRKTEQILDTFKLTPQHAVERGVGEERIKWLSSHSAVPIDQLGEQVKLEIDRIHRPLRETSEQFGPDVEQLAEKNLTYIQQHIDFLTKRFHQSLESQYKKEMEQFTHVDLLLHPNGGLQERVWNILPWINQYGKDVFERLNESTYRFDTPHYMIYV